MSYAKLTERFQQAYRLDHAMTFLSWDQMVMMPEQGNEARSSSIAELASLKHKLLTAPELEEWLQEAQSNDDGSHAAGIREMKRVWKQATCLPAELVVAKIKAGSKCEHGWRTQRGNSDWTGFLANFREVVSLAREEAQLRMQASDGEIATPYEALLDLHCAGDSQSMIDGVFADLRGVLPELLQTVREHQSSREKITLKGRFPLRDQQALCEKLMAVLGFDFKSGRLDQSMHPFSTGVAGDLRITTRFSEGEFVEALNATAHEVGHASYEGGLPAKYEGLPVGSHRNMCIHESQSLLFEKQIAISRSFSGYFIEYIHQYLKESAALGKDALWHMMTKVEPGFIRVEADEVCYPLHVLLRYEIESALINGEIEPDVIPEIWDQKMTEYLGISTGSNHADGCLQDIHWTDGGFGYFPSYTVGAINSAQIFEALCGDHPDWESRFARGDLEFVRIWLEEKIWSHGCAMTSQELMQSATGKGTSPDAYIAHLKKRYLQELH
jgi:carboxypeptidase Taq